MKKGKAAGKWPFYYGMAACTQFIILTVIAMLLYPGGSFIDPDGRRYSFFRSFFSELGMTVTAGGRPNLPSAVLFFVALTIAGSGLIVFYAAKLRFFRRPLGIRLLSILGSIFGLVSGAAFIGIAWTPANLRGAAHSNFVLLAFQTFLVVVVCYALAIILDRDYPNKYGYVYLLFALLLAGYIWLLYNGPSMDTDLGITIQAAGQKAIVYAAIGCTLVQNWGALKQVSRPLKDSTPTA